MGGSVTADQTEIAQSSNTWLHLGKKDTSDCTWHLWLWIRVSSHVLEKFSCKIQMLHEDIPADCAADLPWISTLYIRRVKSGVKIPSRCIVLKGLVHKLDYHEFLHVNGFSPTKYYKKNSVQGGEGAWYLFLWLLHIKTSGLPQWNGLNPCVNLQHFKRQFLLEN